MGCMAIVVNNSKTKIERSASDAPDPIAQTRGKSRIISSDHTCGTANRKSLSGVRENHQGWPDQLWQLRCCDRDGSTRKCRANWAGSGAQSRSPCETCRIRASARQGTSILGCVQPTSLAHRRNLFAKNSAAPRERFNLRYSITNRSFPLVREPDSTRLLPHPRHWQALARIVVYHEK